MVWLLNCWSVHKSQDFFNWIKQKHPNILVVFIPTNYINVLSLIDIILHCPLKYVFKMEFNKWTVGTTKEQIENGKNPNVDFKMNNLKPCMWEWLHNLWKELKSNLKH